MGRLALVKVEELPLGRRPLYFGTKGCDVRELQSILQELRILPQEPTGDYDHLTMEAVRNFQKSFSLAADGEAGFKTLKMLKEPGIWERLYLQVEKEWAVADPGLPGHVSRLAFKDPVNRRRVKKMSNKGQVLIEKREAWSVGFEFNQEEIQDAGFTGFMLGTSSVPKEEKQRGRGRKREGIITFDLYLAGEPKQRMGESAATNQENSFAEKGLVYDLRGMTRISKKTRRKISKGLGTRKQLKKRGVADGSLVFWWLSSSKKIYHNLPGRQEADGVIFSPAIVVDEAYSHRAWQREIRKLLQVYPCTRILAHFDLRGQERAGDGAVNPLSFYETKALRLSGFGSGGSSRHRLEADGWIYIRYQRDAEEREALIPDLRTLQGILARVDRLNLAGVVITGADFVQDRMQTELNRFFAVTPRRWV